METKRITLDADVLESIQSLGLNTAKMTIDEITEATGFSPNEVVRTLRINGLQYVARRFNSGTKGRANPNDSRTLARGGSTAYKPAYRVSNSSTRVVDKVLAIGKRASSMTVGEIAKEAGISYLSAERILKKHKIKHL